MKEGNQLRREELAAVLGCAGAFGGNTFKPSLSAPKPKSTKNDEGAMAQTRRKIKEMPVATYIPPTDDPN